MRFWKHRTRSKIDSELILNNIIETVANTLNTVGSLACVAAGTGIMASYSINQSVDVSYFGMAQSQGSAQLSIDSTNFDIGANETFPVAFEQSLSGAVNYDLKNQVHPQTIQFFSAICIGAGSLLKLASANLKHWNQNSKDNAYFKREEHRSIELPLRKEYLYVSIASFFSSCSYTLFSLSFSNLLFDYLNGLIGSRQAITYPNQGIQAPEGSNYSGPLKNEQFPIDKSYQQQGSFKIASLPFPINFTAVIQLAATANVSFGEELIIHSKKPETPVASFLLPIAALSYWAETYFTNKAARSRDIRICHSGLVDCFYQEEANEERQRLLVEPA